MGIFDTIMWIIRGILIFAFGLLLTLVISLAIIGNTVRYTILDDNFYYAQIDKADAYEITKNVVIASLTDTLVNGMDISGGQNASSGAMSESSSQQIKDDIQAELSNALPTPWFKSQFKGLFSGVLNFINGRSNTLNATVSIKEIKPKLLNTTRNIARKVLYDMVKSQIQSQISAAMSGRAGNFTLPGGMNLSDFNISAINASGMNLNGSTNLNGSANLPSEAEINNMTEALIDQQLAPIEQAIQGTPDNLDLNELTQGSLQQALLQVRQGIEVFFLACTALIILAVTLMLIMAGLTWGHIKATARHIGWPLILGSGLVGAIAFIVPAMLESQILMAVSTLPSGSGVIVSELVFGLTGDFFGKLMLASLIVFILGFALILVSIIYKEKPKEKLEKPAEQAKRKEKEKK